MGEYDYSSLPEEIQVPPEIAFAIAAERPELLKLYSGLPDEQSVDAIVNALRVYMIHAHNLRARCEELEDKLDSLSDYVETVLLATNALKRKLKEV